MKLKSFYEKMPPIGRKIVLKKKEGKNLILTFFKRPYDVNPNKYNKDYYQMTSESSEWVDLEDYIKDHYFWIDMEDSVQNDD